AAGHLALQVARARGAEVFVMTRDRERHQALARELGARWVGGASEAPPEKLDAAIVFAPAGELVPPALATLAPAGRLILGGISMSPLPALPYESLYGERRIESVANNTRADGVAFLAEARAAGVRTHVEVFPLSKADEALARVERGGVRGAAVVVPRPRDPAGLDARGSRGWSAGFASPAGFGEWPAWESGMKSLVLLRHGQSVWNQENRFTGWTDVDLSEQGVAEARAAGRALKAAGLSFDLAFTSVLRRAIKTLWLALEEL